MAELWRNPTDYHREAPSDSWGKFDAEELGRAICHFGIEDGFPTFPIAPTSLASFDYLRSSYTARTWVTDDELRKGLWDPYLANKFNYSCDEKGSTKAGRGLIFLAHRAAQHNGSVEWLLDRKPRPGEYWGKLHNPVPEWQLTNVGMVFVNSALDESQNRQRGIKRRSGLKKVLPRHPYRPAN